MNNITGCSTKKCIGMSLSERLCYPKAMDNLLTKTGCQKYFLRIFRKPLKIFVLVSIE